MRVRRRGIRSGGLGRRLVVPFFLFLFFIDFFDFFDFSFFRVLCFLFEVLGFSERDLDRRIGKKAEKK